MDWSAYNSPLRFSLVVPGTRALWLFVAPTGCVEWASNSQPKEWIERATRSSQPYNPKYGYGFWVNSSGNLWAELPTDAFAMMGYRGNRCWVVPSLDLVVARTGSGPQVMDDMYFPGGCWMRSCRWLGMKRRLWARMLVAVA